MVRSFEPHTRIVYTRSPLERPLCSFLRFSLDGRQTSSAASELLDRRSLSIVGDSATAPSSLPFSYFPVFQFFSPFSPWPYGFPFLPLSSLLSSLLCFPIFSLEFPFTPYLPFLSFSSFTFLPFSLLLRILYTFFTWLCLKITGQILRTLLVILALFGNKRPWERDRNAFVYAPGRPSRPRQRTTGHPIRRPNRPRSIILPTKRLGRVFSSSFSHPFLSLLPRDRTVDLLARSGRQSGKRKEWDDYAVYDSSLFATCCLHDIGRKTDGWKRSGSVRVCKQRKEQMDKGPKRNEEGSGNEILTLCGHTEAEIWVPCWLDFIFNGRISVSRLEASEKISKISEI